MSVIENTKPGAFVSLAQAAEILGISVHTLRRRIAAGELPAFRTGRRIIRIRINDLEKILQRHRARPRDGSGSVCLPRRQRDAGLS